MTAVKQFYFKTGMFFCFLGLLIVIIYPITIINEVDIVTSMSTTFLLIIISISGYLIFNKYNMMLVTDQKHYITLISSAILNILVAISQIILILYGANIILVVLPTPILGIIRLLILRRYVKNNYPYIDYKASKPDKKAISQKWNALSLNVSQMCKIVIPLIVLSFMYDLKVVSVYTVYSMIFRVGSSLIETIGNSLTSIFGNVIAEGDENKLKKVYNISETIIVIFIAILSVSFLKLIHPFISIYIGTNTDISYYCPMLAITFIINEALLNIRFSPKIILKAKGILKQVGKIAVLEIIMCCILTPIFCIFLGFEAILLGSIISGLIQSTFMIVYVYKKVLKVNIIKLIKKLSICTIGIVFSILIIENINLIEPIGYFQWIINAVIVTSITTLIILLLNLILTRKDIIDVWCQIKNIFKRKRR